MDRPDDTIVIYSDGAPEALHAVVLRLYQLAKQMVSAVGVERIDEEGEVHRREWRFTFGEDDDITRVSNAIRQSARGEDCTVRIPGVCSFDPAKTIWSHAPFGAAGKGRSIKSLDLCGAYCCTACDAAIDGQRKPPPGYTREQMLLDWHSGHMRSLVRLRQKGLV